MNLENLNSKDKKSIHQRKGRRTRREEGRRGYRCQISDLEVMKPLQTLPAQKSEL
jgi:hypothetical protein